MKIVLCAFLLPLLLSSLAGAAPSSDRAADARTIRALRLANNRAIARHDAAGMRQDWDANIHLICCGGLVYSGSALAASYEQQEFRDPAFVAYVRIPRRIFVSADGTQAAEDGTWTAVLRSPHPIRSGRYFAGWKKEPAGWKIASESYVTLQSRKGAGEAFHADAVVTLGGSPDWLTVTPGAVWIANDSLKAVQRVSTANDALVAAVRVSGEPCSGLLSAFGSIWVPVCGAHPGLARIDPKTNAVARMLKIAPALSEGGITASLDSVWLVTGDGMLSRIDPKRNRVRQTIAIARGSFNPLYSQGLVWITNGAQSTVTAIDAGSGKIVAVIPAGLHPRFLAAGGGMLWALDQGDGTVAKIDMKRKRLVALVPANIPGGGGEIAYGAGAAWATIIGVPLTRIDAATNAVVQWNGRGGDAVRFGEGAIWLTDYFNGRLFRITPPRYESTRLRARCTRSCFPSSRTP